MQFFFQALCSHIDKNSGEKFDDMFFVKTANKGTSLRNNNSQNAYNFLFTIIPP